MSFKRSWWIWIAVAVVAAFAGAWLARHVDSSAPQLASGTWLPEGRENGDFALIDHEGQPFTAKELRGAPTLAFFGFTHCPDVCPTTLATMAQAKKMAQQENLRLMMVTVDPKRDTPQALAAYVRAFDPQMVGLTGSPEEVTRVGKRFSVASERVEQAGGYTIDHSAAVFLLDDQGRTVAIFTPPFDPARLAEDLKRAAPYLNSKS